jgi:hypothetical protein
MDALGDLYLATDGDNWSCDGRIGNRWVFSKTANPCDDDWVGVECSYGTSDAFYHVTNITLVDCSLAGTIPGSIGSLTKLTVLMLSHNHLHGSIPNVFGELNDLSQLNLRHNMLHGTLPSSMALLSNITSMCLRYNLLFGQIHEAFDPSVQTQLRRIDISNNEFSGPLPGNLFNNTAIEEVSLSANCFSGTLPEAICSATGVAILNMRCLACSPRCTSKLAKTGSFIVSNPVHGTLPPCVFGMPKLQTLQLSYNYLTGALPVNYPSKVSGVLSYVELDYNALTGSIPTTLWPSLNNGDTLDLSHNRLTGEISAPPAALDADSELFLSYNRLSGSAFSSWPGSVYVDILTGNIFGCSNGDHSQLPQKDRNVHNYVCGSDNFNLPIIVWVCAVVGLLVLSCCAWSWPNGLDSCLVVTRLTASVTKWWAALPGEYFSGSLPSLVRVRDLAILLNAVAIALAVLAVCLLAPTYAGLKASYGTYTHQYAWVLSAVLLSGKVPFAVCFVLFLLVLGISVGALFLGHNHTKMSNQSAGGTSSHKTTLPRLITAGLLYVMINFGVVGLVNVSFVAASLYMVAEYQLGVSAFKVGWNLLVAPFFSRWLTYELSARRADWFTLELFVSLMNNIGIPLLAVIFVSPQCLCDMFGVTLAPDQGLIVNRDYCPFYYSYQCSYAYMDFYAAAFVYASLMTSFGVPFLEQLALQLHQRLPRGWILFRCIDTVLPRILKPIETDPARIPDRSILRPFFDTTQFLVAQLTSLALILTMGVVFPPLAVPVAVTMVLSAVYVMLKVGRLLTNASEEKQHKYAEIIEQECDMWPSRSAERRAGVCCGSAAGSTRCSCSTFWATKWASIEPTG